jgi:hypothetical protein
VSVGHHCSILQLPIAQVEGLIVVVCHIRPGDTAGQGQLQVNRYREHYLSNTFHLGPLSSSGSEVTGRLNHVAIPVSVLGRKNKLKSTGKQSPKGESPVDINS